MTTVATSRTRPHLGFGIFTLVMVIGFISLGIWQLQRRRHGLLIAGEPQPLGEIFLWRQHAGLLGKTQIAGHRHGGARSQ